MKIIFVVMPLIALVAAISTAALRQYDQVAPMELASSNESAYLTQCRMRDRAWNLAQPS